MEYTYEQALAIAKTKAIMTLNRSARAVKALEQIKRDAYKTGDMKKLNNARKASEIVFMNIRCAKWTLEG
jgi:hypothetical protein